MLVLDRGELERVVAFGLYDPPGRVVASHLVLFDEVSSRLYPRSPERRTNHGQEVVVKSLNSNAVPRLVLAWPDRPGPPVYVGLPPRALKARRDGLGEREVRDARYVKVGVLGTTAIEHS